MTTRLVCRSAPLPCPDRKSHTKQPTGYIDWHEWAEKMAETHEQAQCSACGLWEIWTKRPETP